MQDTRRDAAFLGRGWSFPPTFEGETGRLEMTAGAHNINQSIDLILKTPKGSRTLMPHFGSNLHRLIFQTLDKELEGDIVDAVRDSLLDCEPRIRVDDVSLKSRDGLSTTVDVYITYTVIRTNSRHNHVYPFANSEGNNLLLNDGGL